jgi:hypothetical protein
MPDFDYTEGALRADPRGLAALICSSSDATRPWQPQELAAVLRHQLTAPIQFDLGQFDPAASARLRLLSESQGLLLQSFAELFRHPNPPIELLEMTKDFAKANRQAPAGVLPGEISAAIYYLSIAAAWVRRGVRISKLGDAELRAGFGWLRSQNWVDAEMRTLLGLACERLPAATGAESPAP